MQCTRAKAPLAPKVVSYADSGRIHFDNFLLKSDSVVFRLQGRWKDRSFVTLEVNSVFLSEANTVHTDF